MEYPASTNKVSPDLSNCYGGKSVYDGVFTAPAKGAAAKLSSTVDYREIFCGGDGSPGSSIPILDVPELRERNVSVDVRSSKLDYADIFGGLRDSDYAVSFEELIAKPKKGRTVPKEARTPAYIRSPLEGSSPNCSQENQASSYEVPRQPLEVKQMKMMYHQTNQGSDNGTNGTTHVAQLHAVPSYTRLIDESTPLRQTQYDSHVSTLESDTCGNMHNGDGTIAGKCSQKSVASLLPGGTNKRTSEDGVKIEKKYKLNKSFSNDIVFDANDFGLGTHPPKVPPPSNLSSNAGDSDRKSKGPVASKIIDSTFDASEAGAGAFSPPYFGEELDENSVAAASLSALKLAIEKAQARMKLAKQLMERKKDLQSGEKLSFEDGSRTKKKRGEKVAGKANGSKVEKVQGICKNVNAPIESFAWAENKNAMKVSQVTTDFRYGKEPLSNKEAVGELQKQDLKTAQADHVLEGKKGWETEEQSCEHFGTDEHSAVTLEVNGEDHLNESMSSTNGYAHKEIRAGAANNQLEKPVDTGTKYKAADEVYEWADSQNKLPANRGENVQKLMSAQEIQDQEDENKLVVQEPDKTEEEVGPPHEQDGYDEKKKEQHESAGIWTNVEVPENISISSKEVIERIENDNKIEETDDQEECPNKSENIHETVKEVRRMQETFGKEENGRRLDESHGREENEKQQNNTDSGKNMEKTGDQVHKQEMIEQRHDKLDEGEDSEEYFEDSMSEENENLEEAEENQQVLNETCQMLEKEKRQEETCEWADTAEVWRGIDQKEAEEKTVDTTQDALKYHGNDLEETDDPCKHDQNEHLQIETKETCRQKENDKHVDITSEAMAYEEDGRIMEVSKSSFASRDNEKGSESVEVANYLDYNEMYDTNGMTDGALDLDEMIKQMKEANEALFFYENREILGNTEIKLGKKPNVQYAEESGIVFVKKHFKELVCELGENDKSVKDAEASIIDEGNGIKSKTCGEEWVSYRETEAAQQPRTSDRREKPMESESSQSTAKIEENHFETLTTKEGEAKDALQKQVDAEQEFIKTLDEAKERQHEREKEKIAVEKAMREARERAFVEARERAAMEKLTAGARRRPVTEARERLRKASVEVNYQSSTDNDAKIKAERAAVERATSEARERALEKAQSGKAASDTTNQAEKVYCGSRDDGMKQSFPSSDTQNRDSGPPSSSRTSNDGVPYSTERFEEATGEVAQRFKAEWERQQRTAERAAKALAEKNMRDLLAQQEQAERNRLAETLDTDIKRWSNGKEGNLRALLSTLHYILGPDSGWQPVPLTDIIATAAVKKSYRRATLFVHPDKLQQRGASIQQKYMCEKVFDLLKEAWDRFNREEP